MHLHKALEADSQPLLWLEELLLITQQGLLLMSQHI